MNKKLLAGFFALLLIALLTACTGDGGEANQPQTQPPTFTPVPPPPPPPTDTPLPDITGHPFGPNTDIRPSDRDIMVELKNGTRSQVVKLAAGIGMHVMDIGGIVGWGSDNLNVDPDVDVKNVNDTPTFIGNVTLYEDQPTATTAPATDTPVPPTATPEPPTMTPTSEPSQTPTMAPSAMPNSSGLVPTGGSVITGTTIVTTTNAFTMTSQGKLPDLPVQASHGKWQISENAQINDDPIVRDWLKRLEDANPTQWKYFPNIGNPDRKDFPTSKAKPAPYGVEYGEDESPYCENHPCDMVVPARHYRLITGDYAFLGQQCRGNDDTGCLLLLFNVGNKSVIWRSQDVDNGFTVMGRYWDGDHLEWGALGLVSHASANMLGMQTFAHPGEPLNFGDGTNAGANCGNPQACTKAVNVLVVISAQERILATARTTVNR